MNKTQKGLFCFARELDNTFILSEGIMYHISRTEEEKFILQECNIPIKYETVGTIISQKHSKVLVIFETPIKPKGKYKWAYNIKLWPGTISTLKEWAGKQI
jgi:hypothetical protein